MIFVTVGGNTPFDRLIRAADLWAGDVSSLEIFAQIGPGKYRPHNMKWVRFLEPAEFQETMLAAELVVSHAGMGTILSAVDARVPLIVLPRIAARHETRNEHQTATVLRFSKEHLFHVAHDENDLIDLLNSRDCLPPLEQERPNLSVVKLQTAITDFVLRS